jgi:hypothetical protein
MRATIAMAGRLLFGLYHVPIWASIVHPPISLGALLETSTNSIAMQVLIIFPPHVLLVVYILQAAKERANFVNCVLCIRSIHGSCPFLIRYNAARGSPRRGSYILHSSVPGRLGI